MRPTFFGVTRICAAVQCKIIPPPNETSGIMIHWGTQLSLSVFGFYFTEHFLQFSHMAAMKIHAHAYHQFIWFLHIVLATGEETQCWICTSVFFHLFLWNCCRARVAHIYKTPMLFKWVLTKSKCYCFLCLPHFKQQIDGCPGLVRKWENLKLKTNKQIPPAIKIRLFFIFYVLQQL